MEMLQLPEGCSVSQEYMTDAGQGVMSRGGGPKNICFSRVTNGIYLHCERLGEPLGCHLIRPGGKSQGSCCWGVRVHLL